jgi:hypothetical protein
MLRLYPNAEATMGEAKLVGETGPDNAGKNLSPTTVKVRFPCSRISAASFLSTRVEINISCV